MCQLQVQSSNEVAEFMEELCKNTLMSVIIGFHRLGSNQIRFLMHIFDVDTLDRTVGGRRHVVTVDLAVSPTADNFSVGGSCDFTLEEEVESHLSPEMKEAVENGVHSSYLQGDTEQTHFSSFSWEGILVTLCRRLY